MPPNTHSLKDKPLKKSSLKAATSGLIVFVIYETSASSDHKVWLAASTSLFPVINCCHGLLHYLLFLLRHHKLKAFCITLSDIFTEDEITPIFRQYSNSLTIAFSVSIATVLIKLALMAITTAMSSAENT